MYKGKVWIGEELFEDSGETPLADAVALEKATGMTWGAWQQGLARGSATCQAIYAWLLWTRDGRDVDFADIVSGKVPLNLESMKFEQPPEPPPEPEPDHRGRRRPQPGPTRRTGSASTGPGTSSSSPSATAGTPETSTG